jgi:hypothetical protein
MEGKTSVTKNLGSYTVMLNRYQRKMELLMKSLVYTVSRLSSHRGVGLQQVDMYVGIAQLFSYTQLKLSLSLHLPILNLI